MKRLPPGLDAKRRPVVAVASDESGKVIVPRRQFRHSSVRGDFRVLPTSTGLVVSWKTELSARTREGKALWRKRGFGRAMAVSPDGKRVVANDERGQVVVLDARTGEQVAPARELGPRSWIWSFSWMLDGKSVLGVFSDTVYRLDAAAEVDGAGAMTIAALSGRRPGGGRVFYTSITAVDGKEALLCDSGGVNGGRILRIDAESGAILAEAKHMGAGDAVLTRDGKRFVVDAYHELGMFDAKTLARLWSVPHPGGDGVRFADSRPSSSEQWKPLPKPSPDGRTIAVNDRSGRLWLLSAESGERLVAYPRTLVNFVEDVDWLDDGALVVIDNDGRVSRIEGTPARVVWAEPDAPPAERLDSP